MLFVGAVGKSAQLPLYLWLPDAMEGPTPVSALIHAATMVTAGVFLMTRVNPMLERRSRLGADADRHRRRRTALFAATIAVAQNDIKKVLAYSTVSQLGYMFLAVGSGAYVAAIFHMVTHAFFKALLFLGSGSVIHGMHDEQDMRRMGALRKLMPITAVTFIVGWLAIAGVPPFAGFWSKDEILLFAFDKSPVLYVLGLVTALLTAYYMTRQVIMVFFGEARWNDTPTSTAPTATSSRTSRPPIDAAPARGARRAVDRRRAHPAAVHRRRPSTSSTGSSPSSSAASGTSTARGRRQQVRAAGASRSLVALAGIAAAYLVYAKQAGQGRRAEDPRRRLVLRPGASARSWAAPAARRSRPSPGSTRNVVDGAVNGTGQLVRGVAGSRPQGADRLRAQLRRRSSASASCCCSPGSFVRGDAVIARCTCGTLGGFPILTALILLPGRRARSRSRCSTQAAPRARQARRADLDGRHRRR